MMIADFNIKNTTRHGGNVCFLQFLKELSVCKNQSSMIRKEEDRGGYHEKPICHQQL